MYTQIGAKVLDVIKNVVWKQNGKGFEKYGETLDDVDYKSYDWNQMALEELADCVQYLVMENEQLKREVKSRNSFTMTEYQEVSKRTMPVANETRYREHHIILYGKGDKSNYALGLNGEAGELGEIVKKNVHHGHDFDRNKFVLEAGDVLHYLAGICTMYNVTLDEVVAENFMKLKKRYNKGFSSEESINRKEG